MGRLGFSLSMLPCLVGLLAFGGCKARPPGEWRPCVEINLESPESFDPDKIPLSDYSTNAPIEEDGGDSINTNHDSPNHCDDAKPEGGDNNTPRDHAPDGRIEAA